MNRGFAAALMVLFAAASGSARQSGGTSVADALLRGGVGARPSALGGAYTAMADGPLSVRYNAAGLAREERSGLLFQYDNALLDIGRSDILFSTPLWGGGLGIGLSMVDYGMFVRTTTANKSGAGSVTAKDYLVRAAYGWSLGRSLDFGGSLGVYRIDLDDVGATGVTGDLAIQYQSPIESVRFGAAIQNVGSRAQFYSRNEALPTALSLGAVYQPNTWATLTADYELVRASGGAVKAGAEILLLDNLMIRGGFDSRNDAGSGLTSGLGFVKDNFSLDYAYVPFGDLGSSHRTSISWAFGPVVAREKRLPPERTTENEPDHAESDEAMSEDDSTADTGRPVAPKVPEPPAKSMTTRTDSKAVAAPAVVSTKSVKRRDPTGPVADWSADSTMLAPTPVPAAAESEFPLAVAETWPAAGPKPDRVSMPKAAETPGGKESREASNRIMAIAREYLDKGDYGRAIVHYRSAVTMDPGNFDALYNLATVYYLMKDYTRALEQYEKAIGVNGNDAEAHQFAGMAARHSGLPEVAAGHWKRVLEIDPQNASAAKQLEILGASR